MVVLAVGLQIQWSKAVIENKQINIEMTENKNINYKLLVAGFILYITVITFSGLVQAIVHSVAIISGLNLMLSFWLSLLTPFVLSVIIAYLVSRKIWKQFDSNPLSITRVIRNLIITLVILWLGQFLYPFLIEDLLISALPKVWTLGLLYSQQQQLIINISEPIVNCLELIALIVAVSIRK